MLGQTSAQPASQLLETCPAPAGKGEGCLPGQLQRCSLRHTCMRRCHPLPGLPVTSDMDTAGLPAHTHLACMLEQTKGRTAPVASFRPTLCPPSVHTPSLCFVCCGSRVRETCASCLCPVRFVPQTSEQGSDVQSLSFTVAKSFSYPQAATPPHESFSIAYSSRVLWE